MTLSTSASWPKRTELSAPRKARKTLRGLGQLGFTELVDGHGSEPGILLKEVLERLSLLRA